MEVFSVALFLVTVLGIVYSTIFAYLEYRMDVRMEYQEALEELAEGEVLHWYVWPLMYQKLDRWKTEQLPRLGDQSHPSFAAFSRRLFCDFKRCMKLDSEETTTFKRHCKEAMDWMHPGWHSSDHGDRLLDDACASYLWKRLPVDELFDYLARIYGV